MLNGQLLAAVKLVEFDALVTYDQNLPCQQNVDLPVGVIVLVAPNNRVETVLRFAPLILNALGCIGVSTPVLICCSPISSSLKCDRLIFPSLSREFNKISFCFIES